MYFLPLTAYVHVCTIATCRLYEKGNMASRWLIALVTAILLNVPECGAKKPNIIIIVADDMVSMRNINFLGFSPSVCD